MEGSCPPVQTLLDKQLLMRDGSPLPERWLCPSASELILIRYWKSKL
jgi:hypothetical protein